MTLVVFLAALIGGMLIGLPICFSLLFSGVSMVLTHKFYHRICFLVQIPSP